MTVMMLFRLGIPHLPATEPYPIEDGTGSQMSAVNSAIVLRLRCVAA